MVCNVTAMMPQRYNVLVIKNPVPKVCNVIYQNLFKILNVLKIHTLIAETSENGETNRGCTEFQSYKNRFDPVPQYGTCTNVTEVNSGKKVNVCLCKDELCNGSDDANSSSTTKGGIVTVIFFFAFSMF